MVIVIDFGGQYNQLVARRVRECNVYCEIYSYKTDIEQIKQMNPKGIILTGGPNSCYEPDSPTYSKELFELGIPVLGLCYGAQLMMHVLGGKVITISGPDGYIYDPDGISGEKIDYMLELRASGNDICEPYAEEFPGATFVPGKKPWEVKCDIALPCATQNELNGDDARMLHDNGVLAVAEVSNMGCTAEASEYFVAQKMVFAPGKAVNAGGVATSGLEMTQNSMRLCWSDEEVDAKLHGIMSSIHDACVEYGKQADGYIDYVKGANIAGFMKVAKAMMAQGIV